MISQTLCKGCPFYLTFIKGEDIFGVWLCRREHMMSDEFPRVLMKLEYPVPVTCHFRLEHMMLNEEVLNK